MANLIEAVPAAPLADIQKRLVEAPRRGAEVDEGQIEVAARDHPAVLSGNVRSRSEGDEAEPAAWSVAGVVRVGDLIVV